MSKLELDSKEELALIALLQRRLTLEFVVVGLDKGACSNWYKPSFPREPCKRILLET